jgi:carbonic anhydrase/acetyltransferase-like protein (isoleucine patch superfamily)
MRKYRLTDETKIVGGHMLKRIQAIVNIRSMGVRSGDLGGFVEREQNLSHEGSAWIANDACVYQGARVEDSACVSMNAEACSKARIRGNAEVFGSANIHGNAEIFGNAKVCGDTIVFGDALIHGVTEIDSGVWSESPLLIQGTRHQLAVVSPDEIAVGCHRHKAKWLREHVDVLGKKYEYTPEQVEEYRAFIELATNWIEARQWNTE